MKKVLLLVCPQPAPGVARHLAPLLSNSTALVTGGKGTWPALHYHSRYKDTRYQPHFTAEKTAAAVAMLRRLA